MNADRKNAIMVGVLFMTATVTALLGYEVILSPILSSPDLLESVFAQSNQFRLGVVLVSINALAVVTIPLLLFPIFKKHHESLALAYIVGRVIELVIFVIGIISLLSLLSLSRQFAQAGTGAANFLAVGMSLVAVHEWSYLLGGGIALGLSALVLNYVLYQTKLIPQFISVWGLLAAMLILTSACLEVFDISPALIISTLLMLPIAVQEMVFAVWLIVKGFNSSTTDSEFTKAGKNISMRPSRA